VDAALVAKQIAVAIGILGAAFGAYLKWGDVSLRAVQGAKGRLLRRAAAEARLVPSASATIEVFIPLNTRAERRAAMELESEDLARLHEKGCWIPVSKSRGQFGQR
jgi:hypothetical protein